VSQAGQLIGRLSRVSFPAQDQLGLTRDGYFVAAPELLRTASSALIHQGALEGSNANGVSELVSMVTVQRSHEMAANILRQVDQSYRRLHQGR
jgi:flagellar basal body rod protein FlgG